MMPLFRNRLLGFISLGLMLSCPVPNVQAQSQPPITCGYDANSGVPNPLGMRAFITLEERNGDTRARFEQLPAPLAGANRATVELERVITFYDTSIDQARQLLLNTPTYYNSLTGDNDPTGFASINALLVCRAGEITRSQPRPANELPNLSLGNTDGRNATGSSATHSPQTATGALPDLSGNPSSGGPANRPNASAADVPYETLATLPDGNYRYWSVVTGTPGVGLTVVSDAELLRQGGALFLFRKIGAEVTGSFAYIDNESICINGRLSGNTVTGTAATTATEGRNLGESFEPWGPGRFMRVRRAQSENGRTTFGGAILDLNGFSRINAGNALPPESCE